MKAAVLMLGLWAAQALAQPNSISFSFNVPQGQQDTSTSAAVYDSTGTMVRWLWGNVTYPPGTYTKVWDGNLYNGTPATAGATYTVKVLENNVVYNYDGRLGTTEKSTNTADRYGTFGWQQGTQFLTFVLTGSKGWFASGYAEGAINVGTFTDANKPQVISQNYQNTHIQMIDIATDGTWVYLLNQGIATGDPTWVTALDAVSGMPVYFSSGTYITGSALAGWPTSYASNTVPSSWMNTTISTVDNGTWAVAKPTNLAVQRSGNILAVAHGANLINLFDKRAGTSLGTITSIANPTWMAFNSEGLWVVSNGGLYLVSGVGGANTVTQPISGFSNVVSVGTNGATNSIFVLDGGTHQQMYEYAVTTHSLMRTYGTAGGFSNCDPTITKTKLMLDQTYTTGLNTPYRSWVRVDDNDNVWLADSGTGFRILHISATNQYIEQVQYIRPNYSFRVSHTLPTRLFINLLEYSTDYTKPILPGDPDPALGGNGSWALVRNWATCGGANILNLNANGSITAVEQLSNGNVYAQFGGNAGGFVSVFQLPASGTAPMRPVATVPTTLRAGMNRNGDLALVGSPALIGTAPNYTIPYYVWPMTGFNANADPVWGAQTTALSITTNASNFFLTPSNGAGGVYSIQEPTSDGVVPVIWTNPYAWTANITKIGIASNVLTVQGVVNTFAFIAGTPITFSGVGTNTFLNGQTVTALTVANNQITAAFTHADVALATDTGKVTYAPPPGQPHLGAMKAGSTSYVWMALPEVTGLFFPDYHGGYPALNGYGGHNGLPPLMVEGQNIIAPFDGQGATVGNQYYHFWSDGLMVGQFGQTHNWPGNASIGATPFAVGTYGYNNLYQDFATNIRADSSTTVNGDIYFYHTDEGGFAPIHRWHISNLSSIHEFAGTGILQVNGAAPLTQLF